MKKHSFRFGPGALVAAAFIGPGTVTTCSMAGARFGYALLWGMLFSIIATIILQEMSARLGIITGHGLGEALRKHFSSRFSRVIAIILVISAITLGNAAFETGNILGTSIGLQSVFSDFSIPLDFYIIVSGFIAFFLLFYGSYRIIERTMIFLVVLMSLTFIATAVIVSPEITKIAEGMFIPSIPTGSLITLIGLVGTTVVPYNLFLHSSAVQERWNRREDIPAARRDISLSVLIGGIISMAIIVTSAVAFSGSAENIYDGTDLGYQLRPLAGKWADYLIGTGLSAAGITSAITAPLAAAYATAGIMGWKRDIKSLRFRVVWSIILFTGIIFSLSGFKPLEAIIFAQAANGILLPVIAIYLLRIMNSRKVMGGNTNNKWSNVAGFIVVLIATGLGMRSLFQVFGII